MKNKIKTILDCSFLLFFIALIVLLIRIELYLSDNIFFGIMKLLGVGILAGFIFILTSFAFVYSSYVLSNHKIFGFWDYLKRNNC